MKCTWQNYLLITVFTLAICSESPARTIKGKVTCGREKISRVIVTDGKNFTQTGRTGKFRMEISDSCKFVYIVTPSGYAGDWSDGARRINHAVVNLRSEKCPVAALTEMQFQRHFRNRTPGYLKQFFQNFLTGGRTCFII